MHGKFVWYELMTTDAAAATAFYRDVVGWRAHDAGMPDMSYTILTAGETPVGGLMTLPKEAADAGARPGWMGYVGVDGVDDGAQKVTAAGGHVHRAPADIPGVGRFSVVADPQGAVYVLFKGSPEMEGSGSGGSQGHVGWHELYAADREAAFGFYSKLYGWTKADTLDMGAMGVYQIFEIGDAQAGGMMTKPDAIPAPFWLYYFNVAAIDPAIARITSSGGQIVHGPSEVPGGSWIVQGVDPQGAMFALVGPRS
jgi:predicted enzyme related to lactoylglutathione lyase